MGNVGWVNIIMGEGVFVLFFFGVLGVNQFPCANLVTPCTCKDGSRT